MISATTPATMPATAKCYRYQVRMTPAQESAVLASLEQQRWLYNEMLRERKNLLAESRRTNRFEQSKRLTALRAADARLGAESRSVSIGTLQRLDDAWARFEKMWRALSASDKGIRPEEAGLPRFLRHGENRTLTWNMGGPKYQRATEEEKAAGRRWNGRVYLPPFGWFRLHGNRDIPDDWQILYDVELTRTPVGWFVTLPCRPAAEAQAATEKRRAEKAERDAKRVEENARQERVAAGLEQDAPPAPKPKYIPKTADEKERERWKEVAERMDARKDGAWGVAGVSLGEGPGAFAIRSDGLALALPAFGEMAAKEMRRLQRHLQRQRDAGQIAALPRIAQIERDASLTDAERDAAIRAVKRAKSRQLRATESQIARLALHVANQRKREHYRIAHQLLTGLAPGTLLAVAAIAPKRAVRRLAARPDAESAVGAEGRTEAFLPNGQARRTERARRVAGNAPGAFLTILEQEAQEVGVVVVRLPGSTASAGAAAAETGMERKNSVSAARRLERAARAGILSVLGA